METQSRKTHPGKKSSPLPLDYTKLVNGVFATNFDASLKALAKLAKGKFRFSTTGGIYPDEVILCVSLLEEGQLAATSVYASCDFDSKASTPTIQDLLSAGVDAVGAVFAQLLDPSDVKTLGKITDRSLAALDKAPLEWTEIEIERTRVWVRVDKANPEIDRMTDDWLAKNDPELQGLLDEEERETSELFFTGPKNVDGSKPDDDDSGNIH